MDETKYHDNKTNNGDHTPRKLEQYLECGKIINVHGLDGTVKIDPWCDSPEVLADMKTLYYKKNGELCELNIKKASIQKRFVLAHFAEVLTIEAAEMLRETVLYASRESFELDEGDHFIVDLIGLPVIDADSGKEYGTLSYVFNAGASDIYTVQTADGEKMIPAVSEFVISVDLEHGIFIRPIEGMFD